MLPNILDVAQEYELTFHPKHFGKKETLAKCPFCKEDSKPDKRKKFYLSLNTEDQVYKCWFCRESGGVLHFEAKLSGKSFNKVKEKHFGKSKKPLHPAFRLDPYQLDQIGWRDYKRKNFKEFQQKREEVIQDWKQYARDELAKNFALFMCIAHLENQEKRKLGLLTWFIQRCWDSLIPNMYESIQDEFLKPENARKSWARKGTNMARTAWRVSVKTLDIDMYNLFMNVIFVDYLIKMSKKKDTFYKERVIIKDFNLVHYIKL